MIRLGNESKVNFDLIKKPTFPGCCVRSFASTLHTAFNSLNFLKSQIPPPFWVFLFEFSLSRKFSFTVRACDSTWRADLYPLCTIREAWREEKKEWKSNNGTFSEDFSSMKAFPGFRLHGDGVSTVLRCQNRPHYISDTWSCFALFVLFASWDSNFCACMISTVSLDLFAW